MRSVTFPQDYANRRPAIPATPRIILWLIQPHVFHRFEGIVGLAILQLILIAIRAAVIG